MNFRQFLGIIITACIVAACGQSGYTTQTQQVEGVTIGFEHPQSAELLQNYELFVTLNAEGKAIENADVVLEMDMPAMEMATNRPVAEPVGNGRYKVTTAYTMEGDWKIIVQANSAGKQYQATFDQVVKAK